MATIGKQASGKLWRFAKSIVGEATSKFASDVQS